MLLMGSHQLFRLGHGMPWLQVRKLLVITRPGTPHHGWAFRTRPS